MGGFPWKKRKGAAGISQMVRDQFRRRKTAASSLLVQTGFPASLVDLVLKNHDRVMKPSRLPKRNPPSPIPTGDPDFSPPPPPVSPPRSPIFAADTVGTDNPAIDSSTVLSALLKIFVLVVLALGTKKFAAGITLSAFVLFFLDYMARKVFRYQILATFGRFITIQVVKDDEIDDGKEKDHPIEEIRIVEDVPSKETDDPSFACKDFEPGETKCVAETTEEDAGACELSQSKRRKSRKAKIRSKMKKLFPSRKGVPKGPKAELNPTGEAESNDAFHDIPHTNEGEVETTLVMLQKGEIDHPGRSSPPTRRECETTLVMKPNVVVRKGNYGYMILVMFALLGLVMGGKAYALTLTLTWCFVSKSTVVRYTVNQTERLLETLCPVA